MSFIRHHSIIVTSSNKGLAKEAHDMARNIFKDDLVSELVSSCKYQSFFIAPDGHHGNGSKSQQVDAQRAEFVAWLKKNDLDWVELSFDDKHGGASILNDCGGIGRKRQSLKNGMLMRPIE